MSQTLLYSSSRGHITIDTLLHCVYCERDFRACSGKDDVPSADGACRLLAAMPHGCSHRLTADAIATGRTIALPLLPDTAPLAANLRHIDCLPVKLSSEGSDALDGTDAVVYRTHRAADDG